MLKTLHPAEAGVARTWRHALALAFVVCLASGCQAFAQGPAPQSDFKVTLLGTGTPTLRFDRFGQSTLVQAGGQTLMFDAGRGAAIRMGQLGIPLSKVNAHFITHYHSDHIVGLPDILMTGWVVPSFARRVKQMVLIGPTGARNLATHLEQAYAADIKIRVEDEKFPAAGASIDAREFDKDGVVYEQDGVKVIAFEVDHGAAIKPAYGYKIEYKGHSVVISGDTRYSENLIKHAAGTDLLIHEVGYARPEMMVNLFAKRVIGHHTTPVECGRVFTQTKPKLAVYSHLVSLANDKISELPLEDMVKQTRETYSGPLEVGEDLMSFDIADKITMKRWGTK